MDVHKSAEADRRESVNKSSHLFEEIVGVYLNQGINNHQINQTRVSIGPIGFEFKSFSHGTTTMIRLSI